MSELETLLRPLHGGKGYAKLKLVDDYLNHGKFPKIHDKIMAAVDQFGIKDAGAFDLGACHGLLSARLARVFPVVIGIEPDARSVEVFERYVKPTAPNASIMLTKLDLLDPTSRAAFQASLIANGVKTFVARRSFPETLGSTYGEDAPMSKCCEAGRAMSEALVSTGVQVIILEGRKTNYKTHAHSLWSADLEVQALGGPWRVTHSAGDVRVLVR